MYELDVTIEHSFETKYCADTPQLADTPQRTDTPQCTDTPQRADTPQCTDTPQRADTTRRTDTPQRADMPHFLLLYFNPLRLADGPTFLFDVIWRKRNCPCCKEKRRDRICFICRIIN